MSRRAKIRATDARMFVEELVESHGRMLDIAEKYPWLIEKNHEVLSDRCRNPVPCFRAMTLKKGDTVRREEVVSTTLRPAYALRIATEAPGIVFQGGSTFELYNVTMRYDVPIEDVVFYVPAVMQWMLREQPNVIERMNVTMHGGDTWKGIDVMGAVVQRREEEVLADVSGLDPEMLVWPTHVSGRRDLHVALSVASGQYDGPEPELEGQVYGDRQSAAKHIEQVAEMAGDWVQGACAW